MTITVTIQILAWDSNSGLLAKIGYQKGRRPKKPLTNKAVDQKGQKPKRSQVSCYMYYIRLLISA